MLSISYLIFDSTFFSRHLFYRWCQVHLTNYFILCSLKRQSIPTIQLESAIWLCGTERMIHGEVARRWNFAEFGVRDSVFVCLHSASAKIITRNDVLLMVLIKMSTKNNKKETLYSIVNKWDRVLGENRWACSIAFRFSSKLCLCS